MSTDLFSSLNVSDNVGLPLSDDVQNALTVEPIIKWAGGKRRLLPEIVKRFPNELLQGKVSTFVEPFLGGGTVLFYLLSNFIDRIDRFIASDINEDVIGLYVAVRDNVDEVVDVALSLRARCGNLSNYKENYYAFRDEFNNYRKTESFDSSIRAGYMIAMANSCFNGMWRVNREGEFNQSCGSYRPNIFSEEKIFTLSKSLRKVEFILGDYSQALADVNNNENCFVYVDPPYRYLASVSKDRLYVSDDFGDEAQVKLFNDLVGLSKRTGAKVMISNSDPTNDDLDDLFFDELYKDWIVERVPIRRLVSANKDRRSIINELIVRNYQY